MRLFPFQRVCSSVVVDSAAQSSAPTTHAECMDKTLHLLTGCVAASMIFFIFSVFKSIENSLFNYPTEYVPMIKRTQKKHYRHAMYIIQRLFNVCQSIHRTHDRKHTHTNVRARWLTRSPIAQSHRRLGKATNNSMPALCFHSNTAPSTILGIKTHAHYMSRSQLSGIAIPCTQCYQYCKHISVL